MHKHFQTAHTQLQAQRESVLAQVMKISTEQYNFSPAPGKWSISQILTHIVTSERLSVGYMKKKSLGVDTLRDSGFGESVRMALFILSQRLPLRYRAPKVVVENTPEALPLNELVDQWNKVRGELAEFLESIDERNVRKVIYKHPVAGRIDAQQAMVFFREHLNHHKPQIERLLT